MNDRTLHILRESTRDLATLNRDLDRGTERREVTLEVWSLPWVVTVEFESSAGERQTFDKPEIPGYLNITAVRSNGMDILPALPLEVVAGIRTELGEEK
jgi:hypothetical protein